MLICAAGHQTHTQQFNFVLANPLIVLALQRGTARDRQCECCQWQDYRFTSRVRLLNEQQGCVKDVLVYLPVFQLLNHNRNHISLLFDCDFCLSVPLSIWACDHRIVLQPCCKSRTLDNFCIYSSFHLQRERERQRERESTLSCLKIAWNVIVILIAACDLCEVVSFVWATSLAA